MQRAKSVDEYIAIAPQWGAELKDGASVLINAQEGKTNALRQWRMTSAEDIRPAVITRYVLEAISLVEAGREIKADRNKAIDVPIELQKALRRHKGASTRFCR